MKENTRISNYKDLIPLCMVPALVRRNEGSCEPYTLRPSPYPSFHPNRVSLANMPLSLTTTRDLIVRPSSLSFPPSHPKQAKSLTNSNRNRRDTAPSPVPPSPPSAPPSSRSSPPLTLPTSPSPPFEQRSSPPSSVQPGPPHRTRPSSPPPPPPKPTRFSAPSSNVLLTCVSCKARYHRSMCTKRGLDPGDP